jgi:uncharacterized protein
MTRGVGIVLAAMVWGSAAAAQDVTFDSSTAMIPMRDGVRLHTTIYVPTGTHPALPIIMFRTPYGIAHAAGTFKNYLKDLAADGYIFVFQDIRGRFLSEGQFVMMRPPRDHKDPKAIDESTDAYDTIAWLLTHVPNNNGRVGMLGVSYPGWLTVMAMLDPHPALKAVSPQASPADMFLGDDFHHNGAFRLSYGFEYAEAMETDKTVHPFDFNRYDTYDWYLALGALSHVNPEYAHDKLPTWNNFATHASYDAFWTRQAATPYMNRVTVPTLTVAGWWDQEDFYGPITIYEALEKHDTHHLNFLVVGPWNHGGWMAGDGQKLGNIDFGSATGDYFRQHVQAPFFAHYLKDREPYAEPKVLVFESGSNTWRSYDSWPAPNVTAETLYLGPGGRLTSTPPTDASDSAFDAYTSDPAHPVPYRRRPIPSTFTANSGWPQWLVEDQRLADGRPDVLTYETEPLAADVTVAGAITAHLFASTSGTDSDWIVKVIDVYPDSFPSNPAMGGYELMVANDVFRGRFRTSFANPTPAVPNHVDEYTIDLHTQSYRFLKGHRIMVQVQSTWFPLIDRNPQTFVPNIFAATDADFQVARQRVYRSRQHATSIELSVDTTRVIQ